MAHLLRLIFAVLVAAFSLAAHSVVPTGYKYDTSTGTPRFFDVASACADFAAVKLAIWGPPATVAVTACAYPGNAVAVVTKANGTTQTYSSSLVRAAGFCPANSTVAGSACSCNSGYIEDPTHTFCKLPPTSSDKWKAWCAAAIQTGIGDVKVSGKAATGGCLANIDIVGSPVDTPGYVAGDVPAGGGCAYYFAGSATVSSQNDAKQWETQGTGILTGGTCMSGNAPVPVDAPPDTTQQPSSAPDPCPSGAVGTVNGATVCANRDPNKGIEGVKVTDSKNADGTSTSVKETTKCDAGQCTTTKETTTKDASGAIVGAPKVEEKKQTIGDKCNTDAGNKVCSTVGMGDGEGGSGMSGSCASGFVVKGEDPILNAMALEQYTRNCQVFATDKPESVVVANASDSTGLQKATTAGDSTVAISSSNFDTSNSLGGGGCSLNKTITVAHMTATLPFNVICDPLAYLGQVLVAVSLLLAARIVARG